MGAMRAQKDHDRQQDALSERSTVSAAPFCVLFNAQEAAQAPSHNMRTRPLVCLGLHDSDICRIFHKFLFENFLSADPSQSVSLGATVEEIERFADVALGLVSPDLQHVAEKTQRAADVVLIDQHMEIGPKRWVGSDIARQLRSRGFRDTICLMSGIGREDLKAMQAAGFVDLASAKGESPVDIATKNLTFAQST